MHTLREQQAGVNPPLCTIPATFGPVKHVAIVCRLDSMYLPFCDHRYRNIDSLFLGRLGRTPTPKRHSEHAAGPDKLSESLASIWQRWKLRIYLPHSKFVGMFYYRRQR